MIGAFDDQATETLVTSLKVCLIGVLGPSILIIGMGYIRWRALVPFFPELDPKLLGWGTISGLHPRPGPACCS